MYVLALACCYVLLAPVWTPPMHVTVYDRARFLQLAVLALAVTLFLLPKVADTATRFWFGLGTPARALVAITLSIGSLSAMLSASPRLGALEIALLLQLVVFFLVVGGAVRQLGARSDGAIAVAACAAAALFVMKFWTTQLIYLAEGKQFSWVAPFLEFANVRFFSQYQSYTLLLLVLPAILFRLNWRWRALVYFVAASFWSLQWMVGTRSVWAGLVAALVIVLIFAGRGRMRWMRDQLLLVLAGGAIALAASILVFSQPQATPVPKKISILERGEYSTNERVTMLTAAFRLIREHPLLGIGPGQFGLVYSETRAAHPHNTPVQLVTEYGVIAGGAAVGLGALLFLFAVATLRRNRSQHVDGVATTLSAALIMGLVDSVFSGNLIMPHSQVMLCVLAAWLVGREFRRSDVDIPSSRVRRASTALQSAALAAVAITTILGISYYDAIQAMPGIAQVWVPHFWQFGRFDAW
ncbi:MAG: O-antigen ligase family protein [Burkholderiales bacterium]